MAETAVKYVLSHPMNPVAIPGATSTEQAKRNAAAGASALPADLYDKLR
jgi:myo-inositol catabolism protein IolS